MKLLLNENLSWRMIKQLTPIFSEVVHAAELKIKQPADDISFWDYARKIDLQSSVKTMISRKLYF